MVDMSTDADGLADFLQCLSGLEEKNSQLFNILSEKIVLDSVKPQLLKISQDNEKYSKILEYISKRIGNSKVKTKKCKKKLSVVCKNTEMILEKVTKKAEISLEDISDYLQILESEGGAAQYLLVQAETFLFMSNEISRIYGMDSKQFNNLLNEMVRDIEENIHLLEEVKHTVEQEYDEDKKHHPTFKYQSPDAWLTPSHSQKSGHVI